MRPCYPKKPAGKARKGREAHRPEYSSGVHVLDPFVDVVAARPDLLKRGRFDAVFLFGTTGNGIETDVGDDRAVEGPDVVAIVGVEEFGRFVPPPLSKVFVEHVRRLTEVVIHTDQNHVVHLHGFPPQIGDTQSLWRNLAGRPPGRAKPPVGLSLWGHGVAKGQGNAGHYDRGIGRRNS